MVDALNGTGTGGSTPNRLSELSSEEFLKIIFTELQKQDPLQPNDSSKLLEQLSSIRSIQSDIELSDQLKSIVTQNQLASAGAMIGNIVSGLDQDNKRVIGQVLSVSRTADGPILNLHNGKRVALDQVDEMTLPPVGEPEDPEDPDETGETGTDTNTDTGNNTGNNGEGTNGTGTGNETETGT